MNPKVIGIRFSDNDFYNTIRPFLLGIAEHQHGGITKEDSRYWKFAEFQSWYLDKNARASKEVPPDLCAET